MAGLGSFMSFVESTPARARSAYPRRATRVVCVGDVGVGGHHPIRVQSMTTPATTNTEATVAQIARLAEAGCEIVRLTVPTTADADNLPVIRREMAARGIRLPLVADIHFTPAAALKAVEHVEKVRINPGNYVDKKRFAAREYTDAEYREELERIERAFTPLVQRCRQLGVAMRIGTNHGSLSDRVMNRYGDTPLGMVESALEFVRICESLGFRDVIVSMKASNPRVMLEAYRLLVRQMDEEGMDYPLHLGVTEAGDGEDARIKSAIGIGALLDEGIGDTIRVSLTEDPVEEVPVARAIAAPYNARAGLEAGPFESTLARLATGGAGERRASREVAVGPRTVGGSRPVLVEVCAHADVSDARALHLEIDSQAGVRVPETTRAELISVEVRSESDLDGLGDLSRSLATVSPSLALSGRLRAGSELAGSSLRRLAASCHRVHAELIGSRDEPPISRIEVLLDATAQAGSALLVEAGSESGSPEEAVHLAVGAARTARRRRDAHLMVALSPTVAGSLLLAQRELVTRLDREGLDVPLVLVDRPAERGRDSLLGPSAHLGGLLCEGIGDAIHVDVAPAERSRRLAFGILQAARVRITRADFISCPSCGRTLFDLEETTARIKKRTAHLRDVKIAVMGCIVNGPGEMADADFGYVGWGDNRIALFVGKELVEKDVPTREADERLVELIKRHGRWIDP